MKKIIALLVIAAVAAFGGIKEDANSKNVKAAFSSKEPIPYTLAMFSTYGGGINSIVGTLQNNVQNLQLPSTTLSITNSWEALFVKVSNYVESSKTKEEYYFRMYQYVSVCFAGLSSLHEPVTSAAIDESKRTNSIITGVFNLLRSSNKPTFQNGALNLILFSQLIDAGSDDAYAKKHFKDNGLQAEWDRVKGELKL